MTGLGKRWVAWQGDEVREAQGAQTRQGSDCGRASDLTLRTAESPGGFWADTV